MEKAFKLEVGSDQIARLTFDLPDEKVNKFSTNAILELEGILDDLSRRDDIKALLMLSGKPNIFIAGADISEIATIKDQADAESKARRGQIVFGKITGLPFPSIAVINGACVGGGLECALACTYRIVTDSEKTKLGLPEVSLGIIPGWGGTQRLPRLIGLPQALKIILSGKAVNGSKSVKLKLADALVASEFVEEKVTEFVSTLLQPGGPEKVELKRKLSFMDTILTKTPLGRRIVFSKARKDLETRTNGHYPAPVKALEVIENTISKPLNRGLEIESKSFSELSGTYVNKNLVQLFFTNEALKKNAGIGDSLHPEPVKSAAVLGAGVMGGGISWLLSSKGLPVRMKDISWDAIATGFAEAGEYYGQLVKRRKMRRSQVPVNMHRISGTVDYSGFRSVDIVIEAVVEDLEIKRKVLSEVESQIRDDTVIASNTSSLSMEDMAAALKRPERFVGMHFFNPVNRMPLVEVIAGPKTSQESLAVVIDLTRRLGKTPIVVNNCSGFLVNRILIPFLNESAYMLQEGTSMQFIDKIIETFGMPMGPFVLADEVGIDVGLKVAKILENAYGERMRVADIMKEVCETGHLLGRKQGKGFYIHNGKAKTPNSNEIGAIAHKLQERLHYPVHQLDRDTVVDRAILPMVNEGARCLGEGIVQKPEYLDMAMIMGTGFPPFRGGLMRYADERGLTDICRRLDALHNEFGERYEPAPLLLEMEKKGELFYATN